nr:WD repeat-containing protein 26 [Aegilops tauschii subsp. strangulata]
MRVWKEEASKFVIAQHHEIPAISCDWSNGGNYLAVGHESATVTIWYDAAVSGSLKHIGTITLPSAQKEVISVSWKYIPAEKFHLLICGTSDGFMAVIKVEGADAHELTWWKDEYNTPLKFVKWLPDDSYSENKNSQFFLYGGFNSLELIRFEMQADVGTFTKITDISGETHKGSVFGISFCDADDSSFLTWGSDGKVKTWSILSRPTDASHLILHTPRKDTDLVPSRPKDKMVNGVDWTSPPFKDLANNYIAIANEDRSITLCNVRPTLVDKIFHDIGQVGLVLCGHKKSVTCLSWYRGHPDKKLRLASSSRDGTIKVWCLQRSTEPSSSQKKK